MPTPWAWSRLPAVSVHVVAGVIVAVAARAGAPDSSARTVAIGVARATHQRACVVRMAPPGYSPLAGAGQRGRALRPGRRGAPATVVAAGSAATGRPGTSARHQRLSNRFVRTVGVTIKHVNASAVMPCSIKDASITDASNRFSTAFQLQWKFHSRAAGEADLRSARVSSASIALHA